MPYVTSIERLAKEEGLEEGIEQGIERGIERGIEQGIERGIEQGTEREQKRFLLRMVSHKLGTLPEALLESINELTAPQ